MVWCFGVRVHPQCLYVFTPVEFMILLLWTANTGYELIRDDQFNPEWQST